MSFIHQTERRAIEAVFEENSLNLNAGQRYFLNDEELFFIGVSVGIGTCSDLHGINIAVFQGGGNLSESSVTPQRICHGLVLIRNLRPDESIGCLYPQQIRNGQIAEGIMPHQSVYRPNGNSMVIFRSTGKTKVFPRIE